MALIQFIKHVMCGWPDESTSSRAHRRADRSALWAMVKRTINRCFFWQADHCRAAYEAEAGRRRFPPEAR